ncbi:MAG: glycosyltransferase [Bacteroidia bacterium]
MPADKTVSRITFFTQSLGRTGSEVVLLNLLKHLDTKYSATLANLYPGELTGKLPASISQVSLLSQRPGNGFFSRVRHYVEREFLLPVKLRPLSSSIWYINTIAMPGLVSYARKHGIRLVVHVHELEQMFAFRTEQEVRDLVEYPEWILANSEATKAVLALYGRTEKVSVCYPAIDTSVIVRDKTLYFLKRKEMGIDPTDVLWVMSGTLDRNKDPFLFMQAAVHLLSLQPKAFFAWLGGSQDVIFEQECKKECKRLGLENRFLWLGKTGDQYLLLFNMADGFLLSSKKESFSLATLEAMLLGLPVVVNDCGGVSELLGKDIGRIVSADNRALGLAQEMNACMNHEWSADAEKQKLRAREFDITRIAPVWNKLLNQIINPG